jgi:hypothetical protein
MNPYQPLDDESQLDRIERKIDKLIAGSFRFQFFGGR